MTKEKNTHEIHDVEGMILERLDILQNGKNNQEKRKARSEIIKLERHLRDVNSKYYNGHKYPERMKGFPDDVPMNVPEVLKLINAPSSQDERSRLVDFEYWSDTIRQGHKPNLEGVSVGKNTFEYVDLGWPKAKEPKQGKLT